MSSGGQFSMSLDKELVIVQCQVPDQMIARLENESDHSGNHKRDSFPFHIAEFLPEDHYEAAEEHKEAERNKVDSTKGLKVSRHGFRNGGERKESHGECSFPLHVTEIFLAEIFSMTCHSCQS